MNHIANAMEKEADEEEAKYTEFLRDIQLKEVQAKKDYRDRLIELVVNDVDGTQDQEDSAGKPFQMLKNGPLYDRSEKKITESEYMEVELNRLLQENDNKIKTANDILSDNTKNLNKRNSSKDQKKGEDVSTIPKNLEFKSGDKPVKNKTSLSNLGSKKVSKGSSFKKPIGQKEKSEPKKSENQTTSKVEESFGYSKFDQSRQDGSMLDKNNSKNSLNSANESYRSTPRELAYAQKKALEDRKKAGKDRSNPEEYNSLMKFSKKETSRPGDTKQIKGSALSKNIDKAGARLSVDRQNQIKKIKEAKDRLEEEKNGARIRSILKNSTVRGQSSEMKPTALLQDIVLGDTAENVSMFRDTIVTFPDDVIEKDEKRAVFRF